MHAMVQPCSCKSVHDAKSHQADKRALMCSVAVSTHAKQHWTLFSSVRIQQRSAAAEDEQKLMAMEL